MSYDPEAFDPDDMDFLNGIDVHRNTEYSPDEYARLVTLLHDAGGEQTDDLCHARSYQFPDGRVVTLAGCGNYTIFEFPYVHDVEGTNVQVLDTVKLCAVCDGLGYMPRFRVGI